jgi:hypothetical protein
MFEQTKYDFRWKKACNGTRDERYNFEWCAMWKHQQATHLKAIEGAVVLDYEILALAHREEVAVLTQQVGHVDGFRCSSIRQITRENTFIHLARFSKTWSQKFGK